MTNRYAILVLEGAERFFESAFSDEAPWANYIRPDIDNHDVSIIPDAIPTATYNFGLLHNTGFKPDFK